MRRMERDCTRTGAGSASKLRPRNKRTAVTGHVKRLTVGGRLALVGPCERLCPEPVEALGTDLVNHTAQFLDLLAKPFKLFLSDAVVF